MCGYKKNRKRKANMWWWNSGVKDDIQKKKEAYIQMTRNPTEKNEYRRLKKAANKAVAIAMKEEAVRKINVLVEIIIMFSDS